MLSFTLPDLHLSLLHQPVPSKLGRTQLRNPRCYAVAGTDDGCSCTNEHEDINVDENDAAAQRKLVAFSVNNSYFGRCKDRRKRER